MKDFLINIAPGVATVLIISIILWIMSRLKKILLLLNQIPEMRCDIQEMKQLSMYQFKRLDAQDGATIQVFGALKNGKVNGEAAEAIEIMSEAKKESDKYISGLFFKDNCSKLGEMKKDAI
jgi:hypothetical protein